MGHETRRNCAESAICNGLQVQLTLKRKVEAESGSAGGGVRPKTRLERCGSSSKGMRRQMKLAREANDEARREDEKTRRLKTEERLSRQFELRDLRERRALTD